MQQLLVRNNWGRKRECAYSRESRDERDVNASELCFQRDVDGANREGRNRRNVLAVMKMSWALLTVRGGQNKWLVMERRASWRPSWRREEEKSGNFYWNCDLECRVNVRKRYQTPRSIGLVLVEENRQRDLTTIRTNLFTYSVLEKEGAAIVAVVRLWVGVEENWASKVEVVDCVWACDASCSQ